MLFTITRQKSLRQRFFVYKQTNKQKTFTIIIINNTSDIKRKTKKKHVATVAVFTRTMFKKNKRFVRRCRIFFLQAIFFQIAIR